MYTSSVIYLFLAVQGYLKVLKGKFLQKIDIRVRSPTIFYLRSCPPFSRKEAGSVHICLFPYSYNSFIVR